MTKNELVDVVSEYNTILSEQLKRILPDQEVTVTIPCGFIWADTNPDEAPTDDEQARKDYWRKEHEFLTQYLSGSVLEYSYYFN